MDLLTLCDDGLITCLQSALSGLLRLPYLPYAWLLLGWTFNRIFGKVVGLTGLIDALYLECVGVNLQFFYVINRWHVLFVMLLVLLLLPELFQLEHLQPALVAEALGAELDHFAIQGVVGRDIMHQLGILGLYEGNY